VLHSVEEGMWRRLYHLRLVIHLGDPLNAPDQPQELLVRLLTISRARHCYPLTLYLNTEILDRKIHLLDQPHEDGCFLRVQPSGTTEAEALCASSVSSTPIFGRRPS
jgi:hypothetical protein